MPIKNLLHIIPNIDKDNKDIQLLRVVQNSHSILIREDPITIRAI